MDAVTYPVSKVSKFINENVVPLMVAFDAAPHAGDFNVKWTPTLVTLDKDGGEHHRTLGFLGPDELLASVLLGMGKVEYDLGSFDKAIERFDTLIAGYPESDSTPEAVFLRGVTLYKKTHEPGHLKDAYEKLHTGYPSSEWARRAQPYNLL